MKRKFADNRPMVKVIEDNVYERLCVLTKNICAAHPCIEMDHKVSIMGHTWNETIIVEDICDRVLSFENWVNLTRNPTDCLFRYCISLYTTECRIPDGIKTITQSAYGFQPRTEPVNLNQIKR